MQSSWNELQHSRVQRRQKVAASYTVTAWLDCAHEQRDTKFKKKHFGNTHKFTSPTFPLIQQVLIVDFLSHTIVIWEKGHVAALSHTYAVKSPLDTMARPKFAPKSTSKLHYLPHPWTRPTCDAKRHPDPIHRFSTIHWTDRQTDRPTDRSRESLTTIGRCATRATRPK